MSEIYFRQPGFTYSPQTIYKKIKKNIKNQEIQDIFVKKKYIKIAFNMTWLNEILKI